MVKIVISRLAERQLKRVPGHIALKFEYWCDLITTIGLREARRYKGFHDEPLKGQRFGERSVRISRSYRAIYRELASGAVELIEVLELNKHDY